jgi:hypothetical protein
MQTGTINACFKLYISFSHKNFLYNAGKIHIGVETRFTNFLYNVVKFTSVWKPDLPMCFTDLGKLNLPVVVPFSA